MENRLEAKTIYACVEEDRWDLDTDEPIIFDGVDTNSFKSAPKTLFSNEGQWTPETWIIALDPGSSNYQRVRSLQANAETEGAWYVVKFELSDGPNSDGLLQPLRASAEANPQRVRVTEIQQLAGSRTRNKLDRFSRLQGAPRATKAQIKALLDLAVDGIQNPMIAVYDVGQASWNALVDTHGCPASAPKVHMFFDFGVPTGWNYKTLPTPPLDPLRDSTVSPNAPVILSHWDQDHWAGAALGQPLYGSRGLKINWDPYAVDNRKWLVPNQGRLSSGQRVSPTSWRLALKLHRRGNLIVWPTLMNTVQSSRGDWLVKCVPTRGVRSDNNNTGIAFSALLHKKWSGYTLCPGDAEFSSVFAHLPSTLKFFNLIASHHGGKLKHPIDIPTARYGKYSRLAISHGGKYGHPSKVAINAYDAKNWSIQRQTINRLPHAGLQDSGTIALPGWPRSFEKRCATCTSRTATCPVQ